ncbi:hypothetical protein KXW63_008318 [Aspergillus fumigatus]|nr:hypothetical protein KXW63_008318 [Aspergillus fumigatus]
MAEASNGQRRDPSKVQAWLVGSGMACLAAAVHLIREGNLPGKNVHILDLHLGFGGEMGTSGDAQNGYFVPFECHPYFHGDCIKDLLSIVPSPGEPGKSMMDDIYSLEKNERRPPQDSGMTRAIKLGKLGPEVVHFRGIQVGLKHRLELMKFILESETSLGAKSINQIFEPSFFEIGFWTRWSTAFAFQPWHSAVEFRRHLRKYLEDIQALNDVKGAYRTKYNLFDSITLPLADFLKGEGVDFRFNVDVTDLLLYPESDPITVSEIKLIKEGDECLITLDPEDICIVDPGYSRSGADFGTDTAPPPFLTSNWEDLMMKEWKLWQKLSDKSPKFGNPSNFLSRALESGVETFTTTLWGPQFMNLYEKLTHDQPRTDALLSLTESKWSITLSIPHQPILPGQPPDAHIVCGYALSPWNEGDFVKKPMFACSGKEIFTEVLSHLGFPVQSILDAATTIPCGLPLGTAPFLTRGNRDRPHVIPPYTTNIACVGQFAELPEDTTLSMEYSVRSAQMAVYQLMDLQKKPAKLKKNILLELFDLLI